MADGLVPLSGSMTNQQLLAVHDRRPVHQQGLDGAGHVVRSGRPRGAVWQDVFERAQAVLSANRGGRRSPGRVLAIRRVRPPARPRRPPADGPTIPPVSVRENPAGRRGEAPAGSASRSRAPSAARLSGRTRAVGLHEVVHQRAVARRPPLEQVAHWVGVGYLGGAPAPVEKLDPKGYELMEKTWGKVPERKNLAVAKGPKLASPDGDGRRR